MRFSHPVLTTLAAGGLLLAVARASDPTPPTASPSAVQPPTSNATAPAPAPAAPVAPASEPAAAPTPATQNPPPSVPPAKVEGSAPAPAAPAPTAPPQPAAPVQPAAAPTPVAPAPPAPTAPAPQLVDSIAALQSAINAAVAGDTITVKNGVYTTSAPIAVNRAGKAGQPITIAAETVGGVEIKGTNGFDVAAPAAHVVVSGFVLTHAAGTDAIGVDTSDVRFTRNTFRCPGDGAYLTVSGDDAQVDHNEFSQKTGAGPMLAVSGPPSQVARRVWIHHNYLHDLANAGSEGAQMVRFGLTSSHGQTTGAGVVEHNLFARCQGVSDLISNRSSGNAYRYNTFLDSPNSHVTLQLGDDCVVYGNYFRNTEGLRIYGARHQVFSNYFEGNYIGIDLGNGAPDPEDGSPNTHTRPDRCVIAFNTFLDNHTHFQMSRRSTSPLGAANTTFADNIIVGGSGVVHIRGPYTGAVWSGNLLWNAADTGDLPPDGYTREDPMLAAGPNGIKRLLPGSPAIGTAVGEFPAVTVDLDGRPRPEKKSRGADEPGNAPAAAKFLTAADVGPGAP